MSILTSAETDRYPFAEISARNVTIDFSNRVFLLTAIRYLRHTGLSAD